MKLDRKQKNIFTNWWWTIDRVTLLVMLSIIAFGSIMITTASPAVAERVGLDPFYFVRHQFVYLLLSLGVIFGMSLLSPENIRRIAFVGITVIILLLILVLFVGAETKGAKRWLSLGSLSLQPSEFSKPFFIIVSAWLLSQSSSRQGVIGLKLNIMLYVLLVTLLILQPDFGMVITISTVWAGQLFIAGIPMLWVFACVVFGMLGVLAAYHFLPHVTYRIDMFLQDSPEKLGYQVKKSMEAFQRGGVFGTGPGEGTVKQHLPDSHTDFIFAVAGEELGVFVCVIVVLLYATIVLRGLYKTTEERDLYVVYSTAGILMLFGLQSVINMGVALHLLPTKGMTLPFISYGGSSMLGISCAMGMLLALTRRRYGNILRKVRK